MPSTKIDISKDTNLNLEALAESLTPEQRAALRERLSDQWWRLGHLYWIQDAWGRTVKFRPNWAQRELWENLWYLNLILKARQLGLSTFVEILMLDVMLFNPGIQCGIVDKTLSDAEVKLGKVRFAYQCLDRPDADCPEAAVAGALVKAGRRLVKDRSLKLTFGNGSALAAGTSHRGGTLQWLHISELGWIAFNDQKRAREIQSGALNTVAAGQYIFCESTHEGGKTGLHYDLVREAMAKQGEALTELDWKFHFFPWHRGAGYTLPPDSVTPRPEMVRYFQKLETRGVTLTPGQRAWYDKKQLQQKEAMWKEFPTIPEEAFDAQVKGAIYGPYLSELRERGRIQDFEPDPVRPVYAFWDLGVSDFTSLWAVQFVEDEVWWLDWFEDSGYGIGHYAAVAREWDARYGKIHTHYLPHDAGHRQGGSGKTCVTYLAEAGVKNVRVVPRTPDVWLGINQLRDLLRKSRIHETRCGRPRTKDGKERLSGLACLETYRTREVDAGGLVKEEPLHDETSHSADAARLVAEAVNRGMVDFTVRLRPRGGGGGDGGPVTSSLRREPGLVENENPWWSEDRKKVEVKTGLRGGNGERRGGKVRR